MDILDVAASGGAAVRVREVCEDARAAATPSRSSILPGRRLARGDLVWSRITARNDEYRVPTMFAKSKTVASDAHFGSLPR
jgi:hypothetical protein